MFDTGVGDEDRGCQNSDLDHRSGQALSFSERHPGPLYLSMVSSGARRKTKVVENSSTDIARLCAGPLVPLVPFFQTISNSCYTRDTLKKGDQRDQGTTII